MAGQKTKVTSVSVKDFIANVDNETRRKDAETLLKLFEKATGWKPQMWGPTIVGFGRYDYTYDTGHTGSICVTGFSPRSSKLVIYAQPDGANTADLLRKLGKHKGGVDSCLYINKLADVDIAVLEDVIKAGVRNMKKLAAEKKWPVSAT